MRSLLKPLLLLTVFLTPLLGAYQALGYEQIKVLFFILSITLIGFIWVFKKPKLEWNLIRLASFIFILTLFIASVLGINPQGSLLGKEPYFQGTIVYAYLYLFSLLISQSKIKLESWAKVLTASSTIVAFLAIKDWVLLNIFQQAVPTYAGRVVSSFGQPNFYAGFLLLTLPFAYLLFKKGNQLMFLVILILITGIFVSYSRSTILLSLILFIFALLDLLKVKVKVGLLVLGVILISILIALKFSSGLIGTEFTKPVITNYSDQTKYTVEKRIYIWPQILEIGLQKPLFGYGLENIDQAFADYFLVNKHKLFEENVEVSPILISLKDVNLDRTHNYILDLFLFSGVIGVLSWVILVVLLIIKTIHYLRGREYNEDILIAALITYLIWVQFQNQSLVHLVYFWLLVGLIDKSIDKTSMI